MEKFKVGKWYRCTETGYIGKYLESSKNFNFIASERLIETDKVKPGCYPFENVRKWIKIDLEEIQQYLPDGHPDKIKEESRSWCVKVTKENREVVRKWMDNADFGITIGSYYGIRQSDFSRFGNMNKKHFKHIISTEEFYNKIGHVEEVVEKYLTDGEVIIKTSNIKDKESYIQGTGIRISVKIYCTDNNFRVSSLRNANNEEKHWLDICIAENRFISKKEALKLNTNKTSINKSKNRNNEKRSIKIFRQSSKVSRGQKPRGHSIQIGRSSRTVKGRYQGNKPNLY